MSDLAIKVENLSKLHKIGARQHRYKSLGVQLPFAMVEKEERIGAGRSAIRKPECPMSTGCCPNHPREDVASFLRFAQAVRGIFFEVRSNLILVPGGDWYQSC